MSAIYVSLDEGYPYQVTVPNTSIGLELEKRDYNTRSTAKLRKRLYNNTYLANVIYCPYGCTNVGKGTQTTGGGGKVVYSCSTCSSTCKNKGYTYVGCLDGGKNCRCETGAVTQKCNLSGSICKANNPRASSCSVQTFTNGTCSCKCIEAGTGKLLGPAPKAGSVASVSKPVTSTTLKPGVIPKAGALGSPEAERTGQTGATATTLNTNTKFGSFDIATLRQQPPATYNAAVAAAAANRQYAALGLLQTAEGRDLYNGLQTTQAKARRIQELMKASKGQMTKEAQQLYNEIKANAVNLNKLHTNWKNSFYAAAFAKSPDAMRAVPIKETEAEQTIAAAEQALKSGIGASKTLATKTPGVGIVASPVISTVGQFLTGVMTGHPVSSGELAANFTSEAKNAATNPGVPDITSSISRIVNENAIYDLISGKSVPFASKEYGVAYSKIIS